MPINNSTKIAILHIIFNTASFMLLGYPPYKPKAKNIPHHPQDICDARSIPLLNDKAYKLRITFIIIVIIRKTLFFFIYSLSFYAQNRLNCIGNKPNMTVLNPTLMLNEELNAQLYKFPISIESINTNKNLIFPFF